LGPYKDLGGKGIAFKRWINCSRDWLDCQGEEETSADGCPNLSNQYLGWMDPTLILELETPEIRSVEFTYPDACPTFSFPFFPQQRLLLLKSFT